MYKVIKPLHYFSPSSFMEYRDCPNKFFLKRLCGFPKEEQESVGVPAVLGTAFDAFVKRWIAKRLGIEDRPDLLHETLIGQVKHERREEILDAARNLAVKYVELEFPQRLIEEEITDVERDEFHLMNLHPDFLGKMDRNNQPIPELRLFGKLDGVIKDTVPFDWKVRGYQSKTGASPTPGYRVYVTNDGKSFDAHVKNGMPIHELHPRWATQLTIYAWMLNRDRIPQENRDVAIDEICYGANNIKFCQIRTHTSLEYQQQLWREMSEAWVAVHQTTELPTAQPGYKCKAFGQLCEVAYFCDEYIQLNTGEYAGVM